MKHADKTIKNFIDICHRLYCKGFVTATDGNISVRINSKSFLITPTGTNKGMIKPDDLVVTDYDGNVIWGNYRPSTELAMHLFVYSKREDVNAVVHAHPPFATGFAVARQQLSTQLLSEAIINLGTIPLADYATPSTREVIKSIEPFVMQTDAILLANHGVVTYGKDLLDAYFKLEKVEHIAQVTYIARMLGGEKFLTSEEVEKLKAISIETNCTDFSEKTAYNLANRKSSSLRTDEEIKNFIRNILKK